MDTPPLVLVELDDVLELVVELLVEEVLLEELLVPLHEPRLLQEPSLPGTVVVYQFA